MIALKSDAAMAEPLTTALEIWKNKNLSDVLTSLEVRLA